MAVDEGAETFEVDDDRATFIVGKLLDVIKAQHTALTAVRPLLREATAALDEVLTRAGVDLPMGSELRMIDTALALGAGVLENTGRLGS